MFGSARKLANSFIASPSTKAPRRSKKNVTLRRSIEALEQRCMLSATRTVDDSFLTPNNVTTFNTIQAAVDASNPGDTIKVKPGNYREDVLVGKTLTILGAEPDLKKAENPIYAS